MRQQERAGGQKKNNRVQINVWTDPIKRYSRDENYMCAIQAIQPGLFITTKKTLAYYRRQQTVNVDNYIKKKYNAHVC